MDTKKLLEELENVIINASDVPFTNKKMVDGEEATRLIDAINQSLPNELDNAKRIVADKERILLDAEKKADDTIAQAKDYIARITEESELVKQAQDRANQIVSAANASAEELRNSSVTYATDVLKYVETNMENMLETLRKNRQSLIDSNAAAQREQDQRRENRIRTIIRIKTKWTEPPFWEAFFLCLMWEQAGWTYAYKHLRINIGIAQG